MNYPPDDSKDTWHMHDDDSWDWGINCGACHTGRTFELQRAPMVGTISGGHNDEYGSARYKFQRDYEPGLDAYKKAKDEGLQPEAPTLQAVEKAHSEVKSHKRALKKLGMQAGEVSVAAGVD